MSRWLKITFNNSDIIVKENQGLAMGNYTFENNESRIKVEYSFGYIKINNLIKIILHHSSIPYQSWIYPGLYQVLWTGVPGGLIILQKWWVN